MTSYERRLGINKSTLWYQKNKVENCIPVKLYPPVLEKIILLFLSSFKASTVSTGICNYIVK
jgi:hypothetical protein